MEDRCWKDGRRPEQLVPLPLDLTIWETVGHDQAASSCVTSQVSGAYGRLLVLKALAQHYRFSAQIKNLINDLSGKQDDLSTKRNRFAHDAWFTGSEDGRIGRFKKMPKGDLVFGVHDEDLEAVPKLLDGIRALQEKAERLRRSVADARGA